ncbi:hypothetical protein B5C34_11500 [Pacificimonas flava]|uniref:DSBA-like thioredoxin domain-containing protein n=2 Tax=Pacificimonas TaxID=1960290 RepID=A0A219B7A0_9SPHN|nr:MULTISPECIES: DsbA family oxidoreductase [Pacificimonas]MBZ6378708.1 DsbA family oxidoreductase [Pacificimonas aurantium]OWV34023.1 hypothetical protein B5C34_11500 [Pacificimonas flava]
MAEISAPPVRIDVISDFVCPWCWIGKRGVDAFARTRPVERIWHPYMLHPGLPPEGMERDALMRMKFGAEGLSRDAGRAISEAAESVGLSIDYSQVERVPNTTDAHRLSKWASGQGVGDEVAEGLFSAYFSRGQDIGQTDVLAEIGAEAGLDADLVRELLASDADRAAVENEAEDFQARGVPGVPAQLIERKGMLVGAQTPEAIAEAVERLTAED